MGARKREAGAQVALALALCAAGISLPSAGRAQDAAPEPSARRDELRNVESDLRATEDRRRKLEAELEGIRTDRARLNAALLETGGKVRQTETRMAEIETRLDVATGSETAIRRSLESRREVIGEVLAALQRMGRRPPPAVLAAPEDVLRAVRTSMLLGAVLPEMRSETQALASDLADLVSVRTAIAGEREQLLRESSTLSQERERLSGLVAARQGALSEAEQQLATQRARSAELARQATDLKDLIARSEAELGAAARAAEDARKADEAVRAASDAAQAKGGSRVAALPFQDPARLAPKVAFADAKGLLPLPVAGRMLKVYGASDGFGGTEKGLSFATRPGALVAAPTDGWVAFSGPYRTYGHLLILNAGGGYYVVLAGMERVSVEVGQFVLAGEPVAAMGDGSAKTAAAIAIGAAQPILYVEFRKDGAAIDPGPWWAKPELEKVRG
ncbi:MAG: Peptidase [Hyphomicrobiales bacterium]|nr:Peptidase [Hyphomicrobiales bacterium]